jgi:hypothetical protein
MSQNNPNPGAAPSSRRAKVPSYLTGALIGLILAALAVGLFYYIFRDRAAYQAEAAKIDPFALQSANIDALKGEIDQYRRLLADDVCANPLAAPPVLFSPRGASLGGEGGLSIPGQTGSPNSPNSPNSPGSPGSSGSPKGAAEPGLGSEPDGPKGSAGPGDDGDDGDEEDSEGLGDEELEEFDEDDEAPFPEVEGADEGTDKGFGGSEVPKDPMDPKDPKNSKDPKDAKDPKAGEAAGESESLLDDIEAATVLILAIADKDITMGTGFFASDNLILTNRHVVDGAISGGDIFIINKNLGGVRKAKLILTSKAGALRDYAVLRTDLPAEDQPKALKISREAKRAERVSAWGYPGLLVDRDPKMTALLNGDLESAPELVYAEGVISVVQTMEGGLPLISHTAEVSHGNSGGPLIGPNGQVLGINTFIRVDDESNRQVNVALGGSDLLRFLAENDIRLD